MIEIIVGDCLESLRKMPSESVHCCVTSPPYFGLRDYGYEGQIGLEQTPEAYVAKLVEVFREVRRVLRDDGTLWLNLGDSYANDAKWGGSSGGKHVQALHGNTGIGRGKKETGLKPKDLMGMPWRVAFALQEDGWYLRQDIIWHKPNPMPESVRDRCTKAHEYIFLLAKAERYYFDGAALKEPLATKPHALGNRKLDVSRNDHDQMQKVWGADGLRNRRSVWTVTTKPFKGAHFATFPPDLIEPCILAGCPVGGTVLDPFGGAGTTGVVCQNRQRNAILCELNPEYAKMARDRIDSKRKGVSNLWDEIENSGIKKSNGVVL